MHRSRLGTLVIDCRTENLEAAVEFWSQALGCPAATSDDPEDGNYIGLETSPNELHLEVQKVDHESRVHIDIETDDQWDYSHGTPRKYTHGTAKLNGGNHRVIIHTTNGNVKIRKSTG